MMVIRAWGIVVAWVLLCALSGPLWVGGFVLAWVHRIIDGIVVAVLRWGFWEPTRVVWLGLVGAYRRASAKASPVVADELERQRKAKDFARRARRVGRGR